MVLNQFYPVPRESRFFEFEDIESDLLEEASIIYDRIVAFAPQVESPNLVHLCGIPGSGKTTYASLFLKVNCDYAGLQFDNVMDSLTGYQRDRELLGLAEAFKKWELPARNIGYHLLQRLMEESKNVLFDHSASDKRHLVLLDKAKSLGYVVEMHHVECDAEEALRRVRDREKFIYGQNPEPMILDRLKLLKQLIPAYKNSVDRFLSIDSEMQTAFYNKMKLAAS